MEILTKDLIKSFSYSTIGKDREGVMSVKIDGRNYTKFGTYQAVTVVGNLYEYVDPSDKQVKRVLLVGASRQHPNDIMINKELAYEAAQLSAQTNPVLVLKVEKPFHRFTFVDLAKAYINSLDLKFVKTKQEIAAAKNNTAA